MTYILLTTHLIHVCQRIILPGGALNTFDRRGCAAGLGLQIRNFAIFMGVEF